MNSIFTRLSDGSPVRVIKKGSNLLFQGEIPRKAFVVKSGLIRSYTITSSGEERVIELHTRGSILPISWLFGKVTSSLFYYDAVVDSQVVGVDPQSLISTVAGDKTMAMQMFEYLSSEHTASLMRINGLEQSRAIEKVGFMLYYLIFKHGKAQQDNFYLITIKLSQLMLSNLVGLTRESTTKSLLELRSKGVISYKNSCYSVNKARLENFLGEDSFRDLKL